LQARKLDVHVAAQPGVEQKIPAGVMIVVIDIDAIAFPFPIAATIQVVIGNHPIRIVIEHHAARAVVNAPGYEDFSYVFVAAVRIRPSRLDAVAVGIPVGMGVVRIVPALVFAIVMTVGIVAILVLLLALVLAVVVMIATVLRRCGNGQRSGQSREKY